MLDGMAQVAALLRSLPPDQMVEVLRMLLPNGGPPNALEGPPGPGDVVVIEADVQPPALGPRIRPENNGHRGSEGKVTT